MKIPGNSIEPKGSAALHHPFRNGMFDKSLKTSLENPFLALTDNCCQKMVSGRNWRRSQILKESDLPHKKRLPTEMGWSEAYKGTLKSLKTDSKNKKPKELKRDKLSDQQNTISTN